MPPSNPYVVVRKQRSFPSAFALLISLSAIWTLVPLVEVEAAAPQIIVDDTAATFVGSWTIWTTQGYPNNGPFKYIAAGSGSSTATYQFTGLSPGSYKVFANWEQFSNRGTNVPFSINAGGSPTNVSVNQTLAPTADATASGENFKLLATVTVTGSTLTVTISNNANGYVIADAIGIDYLGGSTTTGSTTTGSTTTGSTTTGSTTTGSTTTGGGATSGGSSSTTGGAATSGSTTGSLSVRTTLVPGDPGYAAAISSGQYQVVGYGAYVDLPSYDAGGALRTYLPAGYTPPIGAPVPQFNGVWNANSGLTATAGDPGVYDTWWSGYENLGSDGLDNDGNGIIDDEGSTEMNTAPPYAAGLQGIQVKIRAYDPISGTVRETVVNKKFQK